MSPRMRFLLGPTIGESDELTARLVFTPERATQQAGILIYGDADRYLKLGRQFLARPQLEFGMEYNGRYTKPPGTFAYDPEAQTGEAVWLTIRRDEANTAPLSAMTEHIGSHLEMCFPCPERMADARAAIFAHNGRSNAPSAEARFDRVGIGLSFHNRPGGSGRSDPVRRMAGNLHRRAWRRVPALTVSALVLDTSDRRLKPWR